MADVSLTLETGRPTGSAASRRLRREDKIPAVVYGNGVGPISAVVGRRDLRLALTGPAGSNVLLSLSVDGTNHPAVVKELQRDKVRRTVNHVDFLVVNLNVEIDVEVPLVLIGEAKAVVNEGGLVDPQINTITIRTTPRNIPDDITIDITNMVMGESIHVRDLILPDGCTTPLDPDQTVVATLETRATKADVAADEAAAEAAAEANAADS